LRSRQFLFRTGKSVEFFFRDTGIGMSRKILEKLFSLEDQKSRRCTAGEAGTGLGLINFGGTVIALNC
jgi:signal transduction histidine kinase